MRENYIPCMVEWNKHKYTHPEIQLAPRVEQTFQVRQDEDFTTCRIHIVYYLCVREFIVRIHLSACAFAYISMCVYVWYLTAIERNELKKKKKTM